MYQFKSKDLEFGRGSLAELISYDRYAITSNDIFSAKIGDVVIFVKERGKETQLVGTILHQLSEIGCLEVEAHDGSGKYTVLYEHARLVQETKPSQMWSRWAAGSASVETFNKKDIESEFRWLLDGYRYVPGGRIQNMLGQEFTGFHLTKSNLSAYNCLVLPSPNCSEFNTPLENWIEILHIAKKEANAMAFGCGCGLNISSVPVSIPGPDSFCAPTFFLPKTHSEYEGLNLDNFSNGIVIGCPTTQLIQVIKVEDSRFGIFDALMEMVKLIYEDKHVLVDFSNLRAKGAYVKGIDGTSSGAISWMKLFDFVVGLLTKQSVNAVEIGELYALVPHLISQGGQRRGALMLVMNVDHPNILEFIMAKQTAGRLTGANLSVNLTDDFMEDVDFGYPEANELFDQICELAHKSAEPGVLFMDRAQALSNTSYFEDIDAVNPCAEEPLPPDGVCNLAHLNLPRFLFKQQHNGKWQLDYTALNRAIIAGVRFNDNIIDYTPYFDEDIKAVQMGDRRIGMGTMGLATVLIYMEIKYGSLEAEEFSEMLNGFIARTAYQASIDLGKEKGNFSNYDPTQISPSSFLCKITKGMGGIPLSLRNAALLTQAPTGSTGTVIDNLPDYECATGIEPYYAFDYFRASRVGTTVRQEVGIAKRWRAEHPEETELPSYFVGASEITPKEHVLMQASIQKYVDAAISKTINMPADATVEDVKQAYLLAYETGCKGVTVYRDGCRAGQVLAVKEENAKLEDLTMSTEAQEYAKKDVEFTSTVVKLMEENIVKLIETKEFKKRPKVLRGLTVKQATPLGKMYVTLNTSDGMDIEEVFVQLGQVGSDIRAIVDSLGILLTLSLSDRLSSLPQEQKLKWLTSKLIGIKGSNPIGFGPTRVDSLPDAIGKVLKDYLEQDYIKTQEDLDAEKVDIGTADDICPDCGAAAVRRIEGCEKCTNCGASKCG